MSHQITLEELGMIPKTEVPDQNKAIRKNYAFPCGGSMSEAVAKSPNMCHDFAFNPIDAFGENEKGYTPRIPKKKQCDGQIALF